MRKLGLGPSTGRLQGTPGCVATVEWKIVAGCRCIFNEAFSSPFSRPPVASPELRKVYRGAFEGYLAVVVMEQKNMYLVVKNVRGRKELSEACAGRVRGQEVGPT